MKKLLAQILSVGQEFVAWLWGKVDPPQTKPWTAIFYYVAQEDAGVSYPETGLDDKLAVTLDVLKQTNFDATSTHVVYRAVYANPAKLPFASVVGRPLTWATFFPGCSSSWSTPVVVGDDMSCFLKWAYKWCPADQYAVFFWGHSFGPAGLFEPGGPITIPRPTGLESLKQAFAQFMAERAKNKSTPPVRVTTAPALSTASGGTSATPPSHPPSADDLQALQDWASAHPKVEIVTFQDCWMASLETAFELQDVASYVIASQSLVPIGGTQSDFVWPYDQLLAALALGQPLARASQICDLLVDFYIAQMALGRASNLTSIPWSVLDLSAVPTVKTALASLVQYLQLIAPVPSNKALLITPGVIASFSQGSLTAGDPALVDAQSMCYSMAGHSDTTLQQRVTALTTALNSLIQANDAAPHSNPDGFGGTSLFYRFNNSATSFITQVVIDSIYANLHLVKETGWPGLENP